MRLSIFLDSFIPQRRASITPTVGRASTQVILAGQTQTTLKLTV